MLSWSSARHGESADLTAVAAGDEVVGVDHGGELLRFAAECAGRDDAALALARTELTAATDEPFMVDAAAVAANFEMMTRLADATGARMPTDVIESRAAQIGAMGIAGLTSNR